MENLFFKLFFFSHFIWVVLKLKQKCQILAKGLQSAALLLRLQSHCGWKPEADPGSDLDLDLALFHFHAHVG